MKPTVKRDSDRQPEAQNQRTVRVQVVVMHVVVAAKIALQKETIHAYTSTLLRGNSDSW